MSNPFSDIPIRINSDTGLVNAGWWNVFRTALLAVFGTGTFFTDTQFTIADNMTAYTDVTGLVLDASASRAIDIEYTAYRTNGSSIEMRERGVLHCMYKAVAGVWSYERESRGDDAFGNGTISDPLKLTSAGQVQYKSFSVGATYVGTMRYKTVVSFNKET